MVIRGILNALISTLLLLALIAAGISYELSSSITIDNVQNQASNAALGLLNSSNIESQLNTGVNLVQQYCKLDPNYTLDYSLSYQGLSVNITCNDTQNGISGLVNQTVRNFVNQIYYQQYNCNYWDCFNSTSSSGVPLFLISEKSHNYWNEIFYLALAASAALSIILVFFMKKRERLPILLGFLIMLAALPLLAIQKILAFFPKVVSSIAAVFFSQANGVFWEMVILGAAIVIIGLIIELFKAGFKVYDMFSKGEKTEKGQENKKVNNNESKEAQNNNKEKK